MFGSMQFRSVIGKYLCVLKFSFITFKHWDAHNFSFSFFFTFLVRRCIRNISFKNYYFFSDWAKEQIPFSDWAKREPFVRNHCPSVKKFSSPFLRDFPEKHAFQILLKVGIPGHVVMIFVMVASMELLA